MPALRHREPTTDSLFAHQTVGAVKRASQALAQPSYAARRFATMAGVAIWKTKSLDLSLLSETGLFARASNNSRAAGRDVDIRGMG